MNLPIRSLTAPRLSAVVALGSNLGDSRGILLEAERGLQQLSDEPILCSGIYRTEPLDCPPGSPPFLNAVAVIVPLSVETPESLLHKLTELERAAGRRPKTVVNEARPLDLDLIAFGAEVRSSPELVLPHPRAHERLFVLVPLCELAPDLVLPGQRQTVRERIATLGGKQAPPQLEFSR